MNIRDFQAKWRDATLKERTAAQEHFTDLCRVLGVPTPADTLKEAWEAATTPGERTRRRQVFANRPRQESLTHTCRPVGKAL
jgi:hypothetical protein